jgi:hypothetical protein
MSIDLSIEAYATYADGSGTGNPADISFDLTPRNITFPMTVTEKDLPVTFYARFTVNVTEDARDSDCYVLVRARGDMLNPSPAGNYHFVIGKGGKLPDRTPGLPPDQPTANHTFSIYGMVTEDDGTPIPGTTIRLIEAKGNVLNHSDPGIQSTITDSEGCFQFVNVTSGAENCAITIWYPDGKQYFPPENSFRDVHTSGVQYVNVTRIRAYDYTPTPALSSANGALFVIAIFGLVCLLKKRR